MTIKMSDFNESRENAYRMILKGTSWGIYFNMSGIQTDTWTLTKNGLSHKTGFATQQAALDSLNFLLDTEAEKIEHAAWVEKNQPAGTKKLVIAEAIRIISDSSNDYQVRSLMGQWKSRWGKFDASTQELATWALEIIRQYDAACLAMAGMAAKQSYIDELNDLLNDGPDGSTATGEDNQEMAACNTDYEEWLIEVKATCRDEYGVDIENLASNWPAMYATGYYASAAAYEATRVIIKARADIKAKLSQARIEDAEQDTTPLVTITIDQDMAACEVDIERVAEILNMNHEWVIETGVAHEPDMSQVEYGEWSTAFWDAVAQAVDEATAEEVDPEQTNRHVLPILQAVDNLKKDTGVTTLSALINQAAYALQQQVISTPGSDAEATLELARAIENLTLAIDGIQRDGATKHEQYTDNKIACADDQIRSAGRVLSRAWMKHIE